MAYCSPLSEMMGDGSQFFSPVGLLGVWPEGGVGGEGELDPLPP